VILGGTDPAANQQGISLVSLTLYMHPLASFCQKVLIAFYENDTPFEPRIVDLDDATSRAEFLKIWPIGRMPVLRDEARDQTIPESSIIIEYLAQHYPGKMQLVPTDTDFARRAYRIASTICTCRSLCRRS
jgi:glutathione S-transferase